MADVLIVGAGIVGLLSALELTDRGARVTVIDAGGAYPPASWAGGGILSPLYAWRYPDAMNRLTADAPARYRRLVTRLHGYGGLAHDDLNDSGLWVAVAGEERQQALEWARHWRLSCRAEPLAGHLSGALDGAGGGGVWFPDIGNIRNPRLLKALRAVLSHRGVRFVNEAVIAVTPLAQGGLLRLAGGDAARARRVLIAAGAWSPALLAPLGAVPELFPAKGEMLLYNVPPGRVPAMVLTERGYLIPRADGALLVGSTHHRGDASYYPTVVDRWYLQDLAARLLPELASQRPLRHWAGVRPGCGRAWPYLGPVPGCQGVFAAAGHYRNGLVAAPASAELLAQLISDERPSLDPVDYSFSS